MISIPESISKLCLTTVAVIRAIYERKLFFLKIGILA